MLAQEVFPLRLVHLSFHFGLDLVAKLQNLDFLVQQHDDHRHAFTHIQRVEELLLLFHADGEVACDNIGENPRIVDAADEEARFGRDVGAKIDDLLGQLPHGRHQRLDLGGCLLRFGKDPDPGRERGLSGDPTLDLDAGKALNDDVELVPRHLHRLEDLDNRAGEEELGGVGILVLRVLLGNDTQELVASERAFHRFKGLVPAHVDRESKNGEDDRVANREDRQIEFGRKVGLGTLLVARRIEGHGSPAWFGSTYPPCSAGQGPECRQRRVDQRFPPSGLVGRPSRP